MFHDYLYGNQFTAYTDNNPLTYVLTTAKLDAMGHRWVAALSQYNFDIVHRTGSSNRDSDTLSRIRWPQKLKEVVPQVVVQAMCQYATSDESLIESVALDEAVLPDQWDSSPLDQSVDWQKEQEDDLVLSQIINCVVNGTPWPSGPGRSQECKTLVKEKSRLRMRHNLLYRVRCVGDGDSPEMQHQLVIPPTARKCILEQVHDKAGHMGQDRTMALLHSRCFWPGMASDVKEHVRVCARCVWRKHRVNQVAPLKNVFTTQPMELVCMDKPDFGDVQRWFWKHSGGDRPLHKVFSGLSHQEPNCQDDCSSSLQQFHGALRIPCPTAQWPGKEFWE